MKSFPVKDIKTIFVRNVLHYQKKRRILFNRKIKYSDTFNNPISPRRTSPRSLRTLSTSSNNKIADLAKIALEVGLVKPHKRRRLKFLSQNRMDLLIKLEEMGLIDAHHF